MADDDENDYTEELSDLIGDSAAPALSGFDHYVAELEAEEDAQRTAEEIAFRIAEELLAQDERVRKAGLVELAEMDPTTYTLAKYAAGNREVLEIRDEVQRLRIREQAKRLHEQESRTLPERPDAVSLTDLLDQPDEDVQFLVNGLWPVDGKIVLAAQNKAGKTTMVGNLVRSLVDGDAFLGHYKVEQVRRVVLLDNELSPGMVRRWLRDQGITNTDAVDVFAMRGRLSTFGILDPATRAEWADAIGPADVLVFDPLRPALDALGLSEDKESGRFLEALDELVAAAGIAHLAVVHHMGHSNERSRGDSRIEDWPDAKWRLVKMDPGDGSDETSWPRFFSAFGRDVDQPETRLGYSPEDRHLSVVGGSRRQASTDRVQSAVKAYVEANPGCSGSAIERDVEGNTNTIRAATRTLIANGWVRAEPQGPGRATLHYPATPAEGDFAEPLPEA